MSKHKILAGLSVLLGIMSWSCTSDALEDIPDDPVSEIPYEPIELSRGELEASVSLWDFTMSYLKEALAENPNENICFSPLGASMVSGMIANALTEDEGVDFLNKLSLSNDLGSWNSLASKAMERLPLADPGSTIEMANLAWFKNTTGATESYRSILEGMYGARMMSADSWGIDQIGMINEWSNQSTNGSIDRFFADDYDMDGDFMWLNVLHFRGSWRDKFKEKDTHKRMFHCQDGEQIETDMMFYDGNMAVIEIDLRGDIDNPASWIYMLSMPFGNTAYCFSAILPNEYNQDINYIFDTFEYDSKLMEWTHEYLERMKNNKNKNDFNIYLPKFSVEMETDLIPVLEGLGVENQFNTVKMPGIVSDYEDAYLKAFQQSISFTLDENGGEVNVKAQSSGLWFTAGYKGICFDRPFVYLVWERSTGAVLLAGVYMHP